MICSNRRLTWAWLCVVLVCRSPSLAANQAPPVVGGPSCLVKSGEDTYVPPLWMANGSEGPLTFERLARMAAPILWFSPREFLLVESHDVQPTATPLDGSSAAGVVYFRIRQIRLKDPDTARSPTLRTDSTALQNGTSPWDCTLGSQLPLDELDRVTIRYFFYYKEDRGVGGHLHDLEGLELQVRIRRACWKGSCAYSALLESASGASHGVAWYTSVLDVFKARDTEFPLTVLVEENKHASSPDRDGDGVYMPHYDINVSSNDGWGVRDIAGTGTLGSPAYRTEQSRLVRPLHPETRVLPPDDWPARVRAQAVDHEKRLVAVNAVAAEDRLNALPRYELRRSWESKACDQKTRQADRAAIVAAKVAEPSLLVDLIDEPDFCKGPQQLQVKGPFNLKVQKASDVFAIVYPGPRNQYGYMRWTDRMSLSYRHSQGDGFTYVGPPIPGAAAPIFGGWIVGKFNVEFDAHAKRLQTISIDAMYTPSASRSASSYVAVGKEWHYAPGTPADGRLALEGGIKFRFPVEHAPFAKFLGGRIGLRANGLDPITAPRLVFEFGAGTW
jgi:hypothetical protein